MPRVSKVLAAFLSPLALVGPVLAGNVLVVDAQGSGFTEIQPAIDAAQDGDTILVRSGTYPDFWIVNRDLDVVADTGHTVNVSGSVEVRSQVLGRDVLLSGLTVLGADGVHTWSGVGLRLKNNAGAVRVQDCSLRGITTPQGPRAGVTVESCANVAFTNCTLRGSDSWTAPEDGRDGLQSIGSAVALYDCSLFGGRGFTAFFNCEWLCTVGGAGARTDSHLFGYGTSFTGGEGGSPDGSGCCSTDGCDGGSGLAIQTPGGDVILLAPALLSGLGGYADCCGLGGCGTDGSSGLPVDPPGSVAQFITEQPRYLVVPPVVEDRSAVPVTVEGFAGDTVWIRVGRNPDFQFDPNVAGVQLTQVEPYGRTIPLGTIPASGILSTQFALPATRRRVPSGPIGEREGLVERSTGFHLQLLVQTTGGPYLLGNPRSIVVID